MSEETLEERMENAKRKKKTLSDDILTKKTPDIKIEEIENVSTKDEITEYAPIIQDETVEEIETIIDEEIALLEKPQEIKDLETIIDESIEEVNAMIEDETAIKEEIKELIDDPIEDAKLLTYENKDDIADFEKVEQIIKDSEKEFEKVDNNCEFIELLKERHIESLDGINKVLLTANYLIKEKASLSRNVLSLSKDLLGVMEKNHKLENRQNLQSVKWMGMGIVVGGLLVYMFPEYLPYIKNAANYLNKG